MKSIQKSWLKNSLFKHQIKTTKKGLVVVSRNTSLTCYLVNMLPLKILLGKRCVVTPIKLPIACSLTVLCVGLTWADQFHYDYKIPMTNLGTVSDDSEAEISAVQLLKQVSLLVILLCWKNLSIYIFPVVNHNEDAVQTATAKSNFSQYPTSSN